VTQNFTATHRNRAYLQKYLYTCDICGLKTQSLNYIRKCSACEKSLCPQCYFASLCPEHFNALSKPDQLLFVLLEKRTRYTLQSKICYPFLLLFCILPGASFFVPEASRLWFFLITLGLTIAILFYIRYMSGNMKKELLKIQQQKENALKAYNFSIK
jgi:hypothetical protein